MPRKKKIQNLAVHGNLTFASPSAIPFSIVVSGHNNIEVFKICWCRK